LLIATPSAIAAPAPELTVFAAASLAESLQEIGAAYEKAGGSHVAFNFGASSTLARQISEGAPADVFFSADEAKMDGLARQGHVLAETRRSPLANSLVFVVAAGSSIRIASARDLLDASIRVVALAEPQSVPAGIYAKEYLRSIGVWGDVIDKVVPTENVRAAMATVEAGNADAAIVYKTDAAISSKVKVALEVAPADGSEDFVPCRRSHPRAATRRGAALRRLPDIGAGARRLPQPRLHRPRPNRMKAP
jgi:molybdate transport system substrate-binding protein